MSLLPRIPLPASLRALRHRNYQLFISGQIVSLIGAWMHSTAQRWLVFSMTEDAFLLGLVEFAGQVPVLALGLFAGVVADSVNRHRLIITTQCLAMIQAVILAVLTLWHGPDGQPLISIWGVILLATLLGCVSAFDLPGRQSFLIQLVPKEDLNNAIALNSLTFNAARVIGPSIAGAMIALFQELMKERRAFGEGMCFLVNAVSYTAVIFSLLRMKVSASTVARLHGSSIGHLAAGIGYVFRRPHIAGLLVHVGLMAMFAIPYLMLMAVFAKEVLKGDSRTFGYLSAGIGIGAMAGGVMMARRQGLAGLDRVIVSGTAGFSVFVIIVGWTTNLAAACLAVACAGFCMVSAMITSQTLVQTLVDEHFRGRVMSLYTMMAVGFMPFGSLLTGAEAKYLGVPWTMTINGGICLVVAIVLGCLLPYFRRSVQRDTAGALHQA